MEALRLINQPVLSLHNSNGNLSKSTSNILTVLHASHKLHNETCKTQGEIRNAFQILVRIPEGKTPLEKPRSRWEGNSKIKL
jgi:hypothetical protein